jgi:hypothetical protein
MSKAKYFDHHGLEIDEHRAIDCQGVLRDGFSMRIRMQVRDSANSLGTEPLITNGRSLDPLGLHRPGFRVPVVNDRRAVRNAYQHYETELCNRWRAGNEEAERFECLAASAEINGCAHANVLRDHNANMSRTYQDYDADIEKAWRTP